MDASEVSGTEGIADENQEGFVVTQEYIQDSMLSYLLFVLTMESETMKITFSQQ